MGEAIWLRDLLEAERSSRAYRRVWTTYDGLLRDWRRVADRVQGMLGRDWPVPADHAATAVEASLRPALRHFDFALDGPVQGSGPLAGALWRAAQFGVAGQEATLQARFDLVMQAVADNDRTAAVVPLGLAAD